MAKGGKRANAGRKKSGGKCSKDDSPATVAEGARERMARVRRQKTPPRPYEERFGSLKPEPGAGAVGGRPPTGQAGSITGIEKQLRIYYSYFC